MSLRITNKQYLLLDIFLLSLTPAAALSLRVQLPWERGYLTLLLLYTLFSLITKVTAFYFFGVYKQFWRYASVSAFLKVFWAVGAAGVVTTGLVFAFYGTGFPGEISLPRSLPLIDTMLTLLTIGGSRLSLRALNASEREEESQVLGNRVLVVGAGEAGRIVAREIHSSKYIDFDLIGFVDDDPGKIGTVIEGVPVLGALKDIPDIISDHQIEDVFIAMPSVEGALIRKVYTLSENSGIQPKSLPGLYELLTGEVNITRLREVQIGDLLRRQPVSIDASPIEEFLRGKKILITGAGGSIGSELCRQISRFQPSLMLALGHGENSLFQLPSLLQEEQGGEPGVFPELIVADIRDQTRLAGIFSRWKPEIVFHAAAHKHVPLMENNIEDAVTNNVLGTKVLVEESITHGVKNFVLISTDKAVEPVSVMGMTKRISEMLVRQAASETGKPFVSVRFGNVLGSRGSVIPFFQKQITEGGPVTVTHPEVERYFMTGSEAVQLVLEAAALGENGEIFVLDMGEQIKILEIAQEMIELSGFRVDDEIEIVFTGLREGEKISEKLVFDFEEVVTTSHEKILKITSELRYSRNDLEARVDELIRTARTGEREILREKLIELSQLTH